MKGLVHFVVASEVCSNKSCIIWMALTSKLFCVVINCYGD